MPAPRFIEINGKLYAWREIAALRRAPALLRNQRRPAEMKSIAGRHAPSKKRAGPVKASLTCA